MREVSKRVADLKREYCTPKLKVNFHVIDDQLPNYEEQLAKIDASDDSHCLNVIFVT